MIDISLLRGENAEKYIQNILKKDPSFDIQSLISLDASLRKSKGKIEELQFEKNQISANKGVSQEQKDRAIALSKLIDEEKNNQAETEEKFNALLYRCPNFISDVVPAGNKEENKVVKSVGTKPDFAFLPKNHVELNKTLNWIDFGAGTEIAESGFIFYNEQGVKLIYALTMMMLKHNKKWGYNPVMPPYVVSKKSLWRNGLLPKFEGDYYELADDELALTPTAEVCLTNYHADKTYSQKDLPIRNCAWTPCFRREAGGYGANERGLIRVHQFEKVEIYAITEPENSKLELERMVACAEDLLNQLGLCYQVSLLAAQDCSFGSHKTFDIEVWLPGQNKFYEVSSCSNCTDFQARRAKIKFKRDGALKPEFVNTLNASSLALSRIIVALIENYQTADGNVTLPEVLQKEMDNLW